MLGKKIQMMSFKSQTKLLNKKQLIPGKIQNILTNTCDIVQDLEYSASFNNHFLRKKVGLYKVNFFEDVKDHGFSMTSSSIDR